MLAGNQSRETKSAAEQSNAILVHRIWEEEKRRGENPNQPMLALLWEVLVAGAVGGSLAMEAVGTHVGLRSSQLCLYRNQSSALLFFGVPSLPLIQCAFPILFFCKCATFKKAFASDYPLCLLPSCSGPWTHLWASVTLAHQHITARPLGFSQDRVGSYDVSWFSQQGTFL